MAKITIIGSFHGHNSGDNAILSSIVSEFRSVIPTIEFRVPTTRPDIYIKYGVEPIPIGKRRNAFTRMSFNMLGVPPLLSIYKSDMVIITAGILFDMKLLNPWFNYLFSLSIIVAFANLLKKPVICYNVSVGPIKTRLGRILLRNILNKVNLIILRQEESLYLIKELNIPSSKIHLGADVALNTTPAPKERVEQILEELNINLNEKLVGVNLNSYIDEVVIEPKKRLSKPVFSKFMAEVCDYLIENFDVKIVFIMTAWMDDYIVEMTRNKMKHKSKSVIVYNWKYQHNEIMGVLGKLELLIGSRLHSIILACSMFTPVIAINYSPKVKDFMTQIKQEDKIIYFGNFTEQAFKQKINEVWDNRLEIRKELKRDVNKLKSRIRRTTEMTLALLDR